ncbi:MAG: DinB family protein, partial [Chloroflexi bacterium]|nr:DinB family protein [Chloroflexota bacterium]
DAAPQDLAAQFASLRAASLELLQTVTAADLDRTARHAVLGLVSLSNLLHEWAGHDLMHTVQAEQALMQPFIAGCGAWLPFFAQHIIAHP